MRWRRNDQTRIASSGVDGVDALSGSLKLHLCGVRFGSRADVSCAEDCHASPHDAPRLRKHGQRTRRDRCRAVFHFLDGRWREAPTARQLITNPLVFESRPIRNEVAYEKIVSPYPPVLVLK
jgi:hypothetical protein